MENFEHVTARLEQRIEEMLRSVESNMLRRHIERCIYDSFQSDNDVDKKKKIDELMTMFKKKSEF